MGRGRPRELAEFLDATWIDDHLRAALAHAGLIADMGDGGTTVRVSKGSKRRPNNQPG